MTLAITAIYAAILALIMQFLGGRVGAYRGKSKISLGDGGDPELIVRNRQHMNFVENVPMALILLAALELNGASAAWLHALGGTLVAARILHPFGLSVDRMNQPARFAGAGLTAIVLLVSSLKLLWMAFGG